MEKTIFGFPVVEGKFNIEGDIELGDFSPYIQLKIKRRRRDMSFIQYTHHDKKVWVRRNLIGEHRKCCLCWDCKKFEPGDREINCSIANQVYALCVENELVLPVWECPIFAPK